VADIHSARWHPVYCSRMVHAFEPPASADQRPIVPLPDGVEESAFVPTREKPGTDRRWWGRHLSESRWQLECARLFVDPVHGGIGIPHGDGSPVMLIPGFLAGDRSLAVMAQWLRRIGYRPRRSGINLNVDCSDRATDRLTKRLSAIHRQTGCRVALIGHSRGGHFAKALATRSPDRVSQVISLGSGLDTPFDISIPTKAAVAGVRAVLARSEGRPSRGNCLTDTCGCAFTRDYSAPFPRDIPLTSIYSRGDGVVWWEACVVPYARNVEVRGSHVGLAFNRHAYRVIARTLAAGPPESRDEPVRPR
jgi:triacylglycerol lipase